LVRLPLELICVGCPLARKGYRILIIDLRVQGDWRTRLLSALAGEPGYIKPLKPHWVAPAVAWAYAPIARMRVTNSCDRMPLESVAAKTLGLYGYEG